MTSFCVSASLTCSPGCPEIVRPSRTNHPVRGRWHDYAIDLNAKNAAAFGQQLAPYLAHARRAGRAQPRRAARTVANRQRSGDIRAWAKEHGVVVSERGRIPASVVEQYNAAGGR